MTHAVRMPFHFRTDGWKPFMVQLTPHQIDVAHVLASVQSNDAGAVVLFLGTTRASTRQRPTESLDYECYTAMAESQLNALEQQARQRWPDVIGVRIVHRLGHLAIGETSVAIAVSSPHRAAAFDAGRWLIDTIKQVVPIWKRENWTDGTSQWVHPGANMD